MAYQCPRCGKDVQRGSSSGAAVAGGVAASLIYSAFASFECMNCGKIPMREFPDEVRNKARLNSILMVLGAIVLFFGAVLLIAYLKS